jgi:hypothetical protein
MNGPGDGTSDRHEEYLADPSLRETADRTRRVLRSDQIRPAFRDRLRADVVAQAAAGPAGSVRGTGRRGLDTGPTARLRRRPAVTVWVASAAAAAVAVAVAFGYGVVSRPGPRPVPVAALGAVSGTLSADPAAPLRLRFSRPLDRAATSSALRLTPAVSFRSVWQGDTLAISARYGFAPNSAYLLTIDRTVARTADGAPLADDVRVAFGTAPALAVGPAAARPVILPRSPVARAADGSEAVVTRTGALLLTAANLTGGSGRAGLLRVTGGTVERIAPATEAICVSRSGRSIAFLAGGGADAEVVFADADGTPVRRVRVAPDAGSPLGWIGDAEVSYVGGGRLRAVDRTGKVRVLSGTPVDAARDSLALAPGGRYAYLARGPAGPGRLFDLRTGASRVLPGSAGDVAFAAGGATVVWIDRSGGTPRVATAASGGGPVLAVPLPVDPGDKVSDLGVSPDGSRLAYSVTGPGGRAQLRLASLPDGDTLAVSLDGTGEAPNWAPSGRRFTVLGHGADGSRVEEVTVPESTADRQASAEATVAAFADAQLSADPDAQQALATSGSTLPRLTRFTRFAVLWVRTASDGTAEARVRLTADARPDHPARQAEETLTLAPATDDRPPAVRTVTTGPFATAPDGPQLVHVDTHAAPDAVTLTFGSDLDPATVATAVGLSTADGVTVRATTRYDPATRSVTVRPADRSAPVAVVRVSSGLRDVSGHPLAADLKVPATPGS